MSKASTTGLERLQSHARGKNYSSLSLPYVTHSVFCANPQVDEMPRSVVHNMLDSITNGGLPAIFARVVFTTVSRPCDYSAIRERAHLSISKRFSTFKRARQPKTPRQNFKRRPASRCPTRAPFPRIFRAQKGHAVIPRLANVLI